MGNPRILHGHDHSPDEYPNFYEFQDHENLKASAHGGSLCRIKTGTYVGNGGGSSASWVNAQEINIGFEALVVFIFTNFGGSKALPLYMFGDCFPTHESVVFWDSGGGDVDCNDQDYRVRNSSNGFEVNDGGGDNDPNKNGRTYYYIAWG